jgi:hypothetical protein
VAVTHRQLELKTIISLVTRLERLTIDDATQSAVSVAVKREGEVRLMQCCARLAVAEQADSRSVT